MKCRIQDLQPGDYFSFSECGGVHKVRTIDDGIVYYSLAKTGTKWLGTAVEQLGANSQRYIIKLDEPGNTHLNGKRSAEGES